jgi:flagellar biosynthesis/type III secretory pathway protein FliH
VHLAVAIAGRITRREVTRAPEITVDLVAEALRLAAGSSDVALHLHPQDAAALGAQVQLLIDALRPACPASIVPDPKVSPGGCRVETRFGSIDQQFEVQLERIERELN